MEEALYQISGEKIPNERYGVFTFVDEHGNQIGRVDGQTISEPFFKFNSNITDRQILIVPLTKKHYALKIKDQTLAIVKFERVNNDKVINLILNEKQFYRLEEVEKDLNLGIIKFNMFFPIANKSKIEITDELSVAKITLRQRLSSEPFVCLIPIILDHYRSTLKF